MTKVCVNKDLCIGCGACTAIAPDVFEFDDEGLSEVKVENVKEQMVDDVKDAEETCPTSAIKVSEE